MGKKTDEDLAFVDITFWSLSLFTHFDNLVPCPSTTIKLGLKDPYRSLVQTLSHHLNIPTNDGMP